MRWWLAAACVLVLAATLAACGGSSTTVTVTADTEASESGTAGGTTEATESPEATGATESSAAGESPEQEVREAVRAIDEAVLAHDAGKMCSLVTSSFTVKLMAFTGTSSCEEGIESLLEKLPDSQVAEDEQELEELDASGAGGPAIAIEGDEATVTFPHEQIELIHTSSGWLMEGSHDVGP